MRLLELQSRFLRRAASAHVLYLALFGAGMALWLRNDGIETTIPVILICAAPAVVGLVIAFTFGTDYQQNLLRLLAAAGFVPVLLLMWAGSVDGPDPSLPRVVWPWAIAFVVVHAAAFAGSVMWLGTAGSRIPAQAGAAAVSSATLQERLLSLSLSGAPFGITVAKANELQVWFTRPAADGRTLSVILNLDEAARRVRVRERLYLRGATPETEAEASMRAPGDPHFDPKRPHAASVSAITAQVTPIDLAQLKAVPISFDGDCAILPDAFRRSMDGTSMVVLFCAVVTRSGWHWRPAFFGDN